jgi:hypothetical protein
MRAPSEEETAHDSKQHVPHTAFGGHVTVPANNGGRRTYSGANNNNNNNNNHHGTTNTNYNGYAANGEYSSQANAANHNNNNTMSVTEGRGAGQQAEQQQQHQKSAGDGFGSLGGLRFDNAQAGGGGMGTNVQMMKMSNQHLAALMGMSSHSGSPVPVSGMSGMPGKSLQVQFLSGTLTLPGNAGTPGNVFLGSPNNGGSPRGLGGSASMASSSMSLSSMDSTGNVSSGGVLSRSGSPRAMVMGSGMLSSPRNASPGHGAFGDPGPDFSGPGHEDMSQSIWARDAQGMWRGDGGLTIEVGRGKAGPFGNSKSVGGGVGASSQADALWGDREGEVGRLADYLRSTHMSETSIDGAG